MCNLFIYEGTHSWSVRHRDHDRDSHEYVIYKHSMTPPAIHSSYKRFYEPKLVSVALPKKLDEMLRAYIALRGGKI